MKEIRISVPIQLLGLLAVLAAIAAALASQAPEIQRYLKVKSM